MKNLLFLFALAFTFSACQKQDQATLKATTEQPAESAYDSLLAQELGADDYGMKSYVMVFLKNGPKRDQDSTTAAQLQKAHLENIDRLAEEGKLVMAGPFMGKGELRGIYLFDVATVEEARKLTESDPAIKAGRLTMEMHPWYGSAAIVKIDELHRKIAKIYI